MIAYSHCFRAFGNKKNLDKFKSDLLGDGKYDSPNFQKFMPEIEKMGCNKEESQVYCNHLSETLEITREVRDSYVTYEYGTSRFDFTFFYSILAKNYPDLKFDFECSNDSDWHRFKVSFRKGKVTKHIGLIWKVKNCEDGKLKDVLYEKDYLNETKRVIHENIFDPKVGQYDDHTHRFVGNARTITQVGYPEIKQ